MADLQAVTFGRLGEYYSIRHALGQYRSVCVTGVYNISSTTAGQSPEAWAQRGIEQSLQATIRQHPALCYGPEEQDALGPSTRYKQVTRIERQDVITIIDGRRDNSPRAADEVLRHHLESAHAQLWSCNRPFWRLIIIYHADGNATYKSSSSFRVDIAFFAHHAIVDGLGGVAFHHSLMQNLLDLPGPNVEVTWPMTLNERVPYPKVLDDYIDFDESSISSNVPSTEPVWAGGPISLLHGHDFRSRVRILTIPLHDLQGALKMCRKMDITLTGFLHGLICTSLSRAPISAPGLRAITPYSVRHFTKTSTHDIVNHVSYMTTYIPHGKLEQVRQTPPHSSAERDCIVSMARQFGQDIKSELKIFPNNSPVAALRQIENLWAYCQSQMGKARQKTYEISNLGVADNPSRSFTGCPLVLQKLFMTQSGMVTGPALAVNCVSLRDGPLTICITWQHGIVEEGLVESIVLDLEQYFKDTEHYLQT